MSGYVPGPNRPRDVGDWENCMAQSYVPVRNSDPLMQLSRLIEDGLRTRWIVDIEFCMHDFIHFGLISGSTLRRLRGNQKLENVRMYRTAVAG